MINQCDLEFVNWLVRIADPMVNISSLQNSANSKQMAGFFIRKLANSIQITRQQNNNADGLFQQNDLNESLIDDYFCSRLRNYLNQKQWVAVTIPSGINEVADQVLCDPNLFHYLLNSEDNHRGLIIQLDEPPCGLVTILDVHPALRTALNDSINWPGVLIYSPGGDSVFFPLSSSDFMEIDIEARLMWLFSYLNDEPKLELGKLKISYRKEFSEVFESIGSSINILHLSDFHIGSKSAKFRMQRVKEFISLLIEEVGESVTIVPVITGDLMDNPSEQNVNTVRAFWSFLCNLGVEDPLLVLGNNDVRKDGNLNENYQMAIGFPLTKVVWYDDQKLGIICINSVMQGSLENGSISQQQLDEIEYELDRKHNITDYQLIAVLHHHPICHQNAEIEVEKFYEQVIGTGFKPTMALDNADILLEFLKKNSVKAIIHGHRHIPCFSVIEANLPVIGCGSSIGSISEADGSVYFSANIITINTLNHKLSCRFFAYRKLEKGFKESKWHELIYRTELVG